MEKSVAKRTGQVQSPRRRRWWLTGISVVLLLLLADYLLYPLLAPMGGVRLNRGENGLWLRYTWYFGQYNEAQLAALIARVHDGQIRYLYCHVRYLRANGTLNFHYPVSARRLTTALHRALPGVKLLAWVYVGAEGEHPPVQLADAAVRHTALREAVWLVRDGGFDGIQWDYEYCHDGDARLLSLLRETRAALPPGAPLSVCTALWYPSPLPHWIGWSDAYFAQVAANCDQLAVMAYDSGMFLPRSYVWLMRQQVIHATRAAAQGNPRCRVIIGVPTYRAGGPSHHAHAENLRMALIGVRQGLADPHTIPSAFAGIAPFADYTTTPGDWREYVVDWLDD